MSRNRIAMGILSMAILASCTKDVKEQDALSFDDSVNSNNLSAASGREGGQNHVPNEVLIKFKKGTSATSRTNALARISGKVKEHILTKAMERFSDEGIYLVHTPLHALEAIAKAKGLEVEFAEPNWIYTHDVTSNDTYYSTGQLWGMKGGNGSNAEAAWAAGKIGSSTIYIGIIDEGIMDTHEDIQPNFAFGYDFVNNDNNTFDGIDDDHGTHVAGTIGAEGNNGKGVVGVNWDIKMIAAKFLGRNGGTTANAVKAVDYITDLKLSQGLNIVATNNSWGGGGYSSALYQSISKANDAGILFIAAAGNNGTDNDITASYPSNYNLPNVIAVAAIDKAGALASFSQFGKETVDLGAPGVSIISTVPKRSGNKVVSGYASYSGTSMATPHVSGAVALYAFTKNLSPKTAADAAVIKSAILNSAVSTSSLMSKTVTGGRLDVYAALSN